MNASINVLFPSQQMLSFDIASLTNIRLDSVKKDYRTFS